MTVGVLVGRFQPFHNGHLEAVRFALKRVDYLYIVVGSAQKSHERDNPFTAGERIAMIKAALDDAGIPPGRWMALPLRDSDSHALWTASLRENVPRFDIVFTNDALTTTLLREEGAKVVAVSYYRRERFSATNVRKGILERREWEKLVPGPVARMVKEIGGVQRVRSMVHKDLTGAPGSDEQ